MPSAHLLTRAAPTAGPALIAAAERDAAAARARLDEAGATLGRPAGLRLDDETRARADLLIETTLATIEARLRGAEPLLDGPGGPVAPAFHAAGLLGRSGLAAAALVRVEEHRLAAALIAVGDPEEEGPGARALDPIGGDLAAESFAVRAAEAARLGREGDPLLPLHDLAAEDRHALFWQIAACLADAALAAQGEARDAVEEDVHRAAAAAVARGLAAIDEAEGIAACAMRLAHALDAAGALDDAMLAGTLAAGRVATLAGMLATRAGIGFDAARAALSAPARAAVLLRACDAERTVATAMTLTLACALDRGEGEDPVERAVEIMDSFDALPVALARSEVRRLRLEPVYGDTLVALGRPR